MAEQAFTRELDAHYIVLSYKEKQLFSISTQANTLYSRYIKVPEFFIHFYENNYASIKGLYQCATVNFQFLSALLLLLIRHIPICP